MEVLRDQKCDSQNMECLRGKDLRIHLTNLSALGEKTFGSEREDNLFRVPWLAGGSYRTSREQMGHQAWTGTSCSEVSGESGP